MPGMMDTVLNLGLNDVSVKGLAKQTANDRFAYDSYRRFVQMFGKIVLDIPGERFEDALAELRTREGVATDPELSADALAGLVETFQGIVRQAANLEFPQQPTDQLRFAIEAVFRSWNGRRAHDYRRLEGIPDDLGTAVNVQTMVFGNKGDDSGTGVAFTRDPATGEHRPYGDFLANAQGEDVVAGIRTTEPLDGMAAHFPGPHRELLDVMQRLESHYHDMCDIEFTIEQGRLFLLQTRVGKRTAAAALRMAVDMEHEGLIDQRQAVLRVQPTQLDQLLHAQFDPQAKYTALTKGLNASPGAAVGRACFTADDAAGARRGRGSASILVRPETSPDDLHGMIAAEGILTARGGLVSHAAVVARGDGEARGVRRERARHPRRRGRGARRRHGRARRGGAVDQRDDRRGRRRRGAGHHPRAERPVRHDPRRGPTSSVASACARTPTCPTTRPWRAASARRGSACAAPSTCSSATDSRSCSATSSPPRSTRPTPRCRSSRPRQRSDFVGILEAMDGLPVTVRLLDPPLHEFLPDVEELLVQDARGQLDDSGRKLLHVAEQWREANPMLGTRGVRLGVLRPALYRTQVRALLDAAMERKLAGGDPKVEIMIPLTVSRAELALAVSWVKEVADETASETYGASGVDVAVGTMIETPRAVLVADEIAEVADFFSFGTNDLTQMTFGFSRDDIEGRFMPRYLELGLLPANPFETIDVEGVGALVRTAVEAGREARPDLKLGICGEHGGDPASVAFCHEVGLDYVSCSPYRVPIARLAAAHAALAAQGPASTA